MLLQLITHDIVKKQRNIISTCVNQLRGQPFDLRRTLSLCIQEKNKLAIKWPPFWIYTYLYLMVLFPPKFMENAINLILIQ